MTPLAHVVQVAIVGGAIVGVLVLFGGTAAVDYFNAKARAAAAVVVDQGDGIDPEFEEYLDILDDEVDLPEPDDSGAEWDRARDRDLDYRWGAA
ncbi:hypothetical protein [Nocardia brasiliensis]|uniref:hypothetical protein n=1 Tax=Nocardia brasiliensis TaxID=37326 RepID=UPI00366E57B3